MDVRLRPLQESDARVSVHWRNDAEIWRDTKSRPSRQITLSDELAWIRKTLADGSARRFAIIADGTYVGNIYLTNIDYGRAEFHLFIGEKAYWGKGVGRAASRALIEIARADLGLAEIHLSVRHRNRAALSLYESLGFGETGRDADYVCMSLVLDSARPVQSASAED